MVGWLRILRRGGWVGIRTRDGADRDQGSCLASCSTGCDEAGSACHNPGLADTSLPSCSPSMHGEACHQGAWVGGAGLERAGAQSWRSQCYNRLESCGRRERRLWLVGWYRQRILAHAFSRSSTSPSISAPCIASPHKFWGSIVTVHKESACSGTRRTETKAIPCPMHSQRHATVSHDVMLRTHAHNKVVAGADHRRPTP